MTRPTCPSCLAPLQLLSLGAVELDRCFACGGLWFNRGELEEVSGRGLTVLPEPTAQATHRCIFCGELMVRGTFRKAVAQSCPRCDSVFLPEPAVVELVGQELTDAVAKRRAVQRGASSELKPRFKVTFVCAGACRDRYELARGTATGRGLACSTCAPALPEEKKAPPPPRDRDDTLSWLSVALDLLFS